MLSFSWVSVPKNPSTRPGSACLMSRALAVLYTYALQVVRAMDLVKLTLSLTHHHCSPLRPGQSSVCTPVTKSPIYVAKFSSAILLLYP